MAYSKQVDIADYKPPAPSDGDELKAELDPSSEEYRAALSLWKSFKNGDKFTPQSIYKLSNSVTFKKFAENVEKYREKPGAVVMSLLHGTKPDYVESIIEENLLGSKMEHDDYAREQKWYCGEGIYFSYSASYASCDYFTKFPYAPKDDTRDRHIFLCDVLVGNVCPLPKGERNLPEGFDTARPEHPNVESYAKFEDHEFYPTHLFVVKKIE